MKKIVFVFMFILLVSSSGAQELFLKKQRGLFTRQLKSDRHWCITLKDSSEFNGFMVAYTDSSFLVVYGTNPRPVDLKTLTADTVIPEKTGRWVFFNQISRLAVPRIKGERVFEGESIGTALLLFSIAGPFMLVAAPIQWLVKKDDPAIGLVVGTAFTSYLYIFGFHMYGENKFNLEKKWKIVTADELNQRK